MYVSIYEVIMVSLLKGIHVEVVLTDKLDLMN